MAAPPRPAHVDPLLSAEDWRGALRLAYDALLSERLRSADAELDLSRRQTVVALGAALLERFDIRPPAGAAPRSDKLARALVAEIELDNAAAAGKALAELYELALGAAGRRNLGAVYTPREIVDFMVREALAAHLTEAIESDLSAARQIVDGSTDDLNDEQAGAIAKRLLGLRLVDPAAGAGVFLLAAATRIANLADRLAQRELAGLERVSTRYRALRHCCRGYELDGHAVQVATAVLGLSAYERPGSEIPAVVTQRDPLLTGMMHEAPQGGWDVIVMNPPYMGGKHVRTRLGDDFSAALRRADGFSGDLLAHFLFRALAAVREGGVVSAIVSDTAFTIEATATLRHKLLDEALLVSVAWCKPFESVAVRGGIVTVARRKPRAGSRVECRDASYGGSPAHAPVLRVARRSFRELPGRPIYRPSAAALALVERWAQVDSLPERWRQMTGRSSTATANERWQIGSWTLLGCAVRAGQGLATGDDRRFVGYVSDTPEGRLALSRQREILNAIRKDRDSRHAWTALRRRLGKGLDLGPALVELNDRGEALPGRKPFLTVERSQVRDRPLTPDEIESGIVEPPHWVPYETSDRTADGRGARWWRPDNPVVLDWSTEAVALLRSRRRNGPRRPVLRNEDLWFQGGVTHNRISSHVAARLMPHHAIFSSESPLYVPHVNWLSPLALLALLNSPVVEFALKTFLASRNHIEVGHIRRLPIPVLDGSQLGKLEELGDRALRASRRRPVDLGEIERELDEVTRKLYGVEDLALDTVR